MSNSVRVLGVDPGSRHTGYSIVQQIAGRFQLIAHGVIRTTTTKPMAERLLENHNGLQAVITEHPPTTAAIESIFAGKSARSALILGQARGTALLVLAQNELAVTEYSPTSIKKSVGGHGRAGKNEIISIVSRLVGRTDPLPADAADATAIAITHILHSRFNHRLGESAVRTGSATSRGRARR